jgi:hypothetical protein
MAHFTGSSHLECKVCHKVHRNVAKLLGPRAPDDWMLVNPGERLEAELTPDICILPCNGCTRHFIRGHLQLPVDESDFGTFVWSVWVELDEASMTEVARAWNNPNRASMPPLVGRLATELPYEQPTKGLPVSVHTRDLGQVPLLMLYPGIHHSLASEQREGIAVHRAAELAGRVGR